MYYDFETCYGHLKVSIKKINFWIKDNNNDVVISILIILVEIQSDRVAQLHLLTTKNELP